MRRFALAVTILGVLSVPAVATGSTRLGPDLSVYYPTGSSISCNLAPYTPCTYANMQCNNSQSLAASPIDGVITSWHFKAGLAPDTSTKAITLQILVPAPNDGTSGYGWITRKGTGPTVTVPAGQTLNGNIPVDVPTRVSISAGDEVGIVADYGVSVFGIPINNGPNSAAYFYNGFDYGFSGGGAWSTNVQVEPDADHDGYGDETQDCDPLNASRNEPDG